jgi:hypothetical protein
MAQGSKYPPYRASARGMITGYNGFRTEKLSWIDEAPS